MEREVWYLVHANYLKPRMEKASVQVNGLVN